MDLSADDLEAQALELGRRSNRGRAIEFLERALKLEPKRGRLHRLLGVLYRDTGRLAKAERSFRKATRLDPRDALAWADLAAILERSGSHTEALKSIDRAVALSPKDAGMRADRSIIRYRLGQIDAAIDDGVWAVERLPDAPRLTLDVALMRLTRGKRADITAALAMLTKARAILNDDPAVALAHAQALMVAGRVQPAIQAYEALLTRNPRQAWANWGRGLLAWRESHWDRAKKHGRKARQVLPHIFTSRGHNRRQFFAKDARAYLRWLDDELEPSVQSKSIPGGPAVLEHLKVRGGCKREAIRKSLKAIMPPIRACFGERAGRVEVRFTVARRQAKAVNRASGGVSRDGDACILRAVRKATFPKEASCRVVAAWNRPIQPPSMTIIPGP
ncbi:MAG: tetratricopeptide repeat protein [Myxococcota bacterium]|nr:tetratricopeptide repeat protein [Myxococcota bacterium]